MWSVAQRAHHKRLSPFVENGEESDLATEVSRNPFILTSVNNAVRIAG